MNILKCLINEWTNKLLNVDYLNPLIHLYEEYNIQVSAIYKSLSIKQVSFKNLLSHIFTNLKIFKDLFKLKEKLIYYW